MRLAWKAAAVLVALSVCGAEAPMQASAVIEVWNCHYDRAPNEFPSAIQFQLRKDVRGALTIIEPDHAPYEVRVNDDQVISAVSLSDTSSSKRWKGLMISAEALEIDKPSGYSTLTAFRLDDSPGPGVHGTCRSQR